MCRVCSTRSKLNGLGQRRARASRSYKQGFTTRAIQKTYSSTKTIDRAPLAIASDHTAASAAGEFGRDINGENQPENRSQI
jgi:hypothetical protein